MLYSAQTAGTVLMYCWTHERLFDSSAPIKVWQESGCVRGMRNNTSATCDISIVDLVRVEDGPDMRSTDRPVE